MEMDQGRSRSRLRRLCTNTRICGRTPAEVPAELAAEIERIETRLGELDDQKFAEDEWTAELAAEVEQLEERRTEIDDIIDGLAVYSDEDRARAGCIVTIGDNGSSACIRGWSNAGR